MPTNGVLEVAGDEDFLQLSLNAGTTYRISLSGAASPGPFPTNFLRLVGRSGGDLAADQPRSEGPGAPDGSIVFTPSQSGTYFVGVQGFTAGSYTLNLQTVTDDLPDNFTTGTTVSVGQSASGVLNVAGDEDFMRAVLTGGTTYQLTASGAANSLTVESLTDSDLSATGGRFEQSVDGKVVFTPFQTGTFLIGARSDGGTTGAFTVSLATVEDDFADTANTTGTVSVGGSLGGVLNVAGDTDFVKVALTAGTTYVVSATGAADSLGVISAEDGELAAGQGRGEFSQSSDRSIVFTPLQSGNFYISLGSATGKGTGAYTVSVRTQQDDRPDTAATTGTLNAAATAVGTLEVNGDEDFFKVTLTAGETYEFKPEGAANDLRILSRTDGEFAPGTGREEASGAQNGTLVFTPLTSGDFLLAVSNRTNAATGSYQVVMNQAADDFADNAGTAGRATVGGVASGSIERAGDEDWFRIRLEAGTTYRFKPEGEGATVFVASAADGELVPGQGRIELPLNIDGAVVFTPQQSGDHYIVVQGDETDGTEFDYSIKVETVRDDLPDHAGTPGRLSLAQGAITPAEFVLRRSNGDILTWDSTKGGNGFKELASFNAGTTVRGVGDFTGDGKADMLLQIGPTSYVTWDVSKAGNGFANVPDLGAFQPLHVGNFLGASAGDEILLADSATGTLRFLNPGSGQSADFLTLGAGFSVVGTGNIDGSGTEDIVFRNDVSGAQFYWNGSGFTDLLGLAPESGWRIAAIGNFVGEAADDFLFFNTNSRTLLFWNAGQGAGGFSNFVTLSTDFALTGIGDFNGDGRDDILLQHVSNGSAIYWNGNTFADLGQVLGGVQLAGIGDFG